MESLHIKNPLFEMPKIKNSQLAEVAPIAWTLMSPDLTMCDFFLVVFQNITY